MYVETYPRKTTEELLQSLVALHTLLVLDDSSSHKQYSGSQTKKLFFFVVFLVKIFDRKEGNVIKNEPQARTRTRPK